MSDYKYQEKLLCREVDAMKLEKEATGCVERLEKCHVLIKAIEEGERCCASSKTVGWILMRLP